MPLLPCGKEKLSTVDVKRCPAVGNNRSMTMPLSHVHLSAPCGSLPGALHVSCVHARREEEISRKPWGLLLLLPSLLLFMLLPQCRLLHAPEFKGLRQRTPADPFAAFGK